MHETSSSSPLPHLSNGITVAQALTYLHQGWSVIPVVFQTEKAGKVSKRPAIKWQVYQQRLPTEAEVRAWFDKETYPGIGVVTGRISGIVVVDIEQAATADDVVGIASPLESRTLHGGRHIFYRWTKPTANAVRLANKSIDLRGDGGFIVLPPSRLGTRGYTWLKQADVHSLSPLPAFIERMINQATPPTAKTNPHLPDGTLPQAVGSPLPSAHQGQRNMTATQVTGMLCAHISARLWESVAWPTLVQWNETQCHPPLLSGELRSVWKSISSTHQRNHANESQRNKAEQKPIAILPWQNFCKQAFKEPEWVIDQLIPKRGLIAVAGPPESGKSYFTTAIAIAVAQGCRLFDSYATNQTAVLIIDQENLPAWIQQRLTQFGAQADLPLHIYASRDCPFNLEDSAAFEQVIQYIEAQEIGLLILDTLRLSHNRDENSSTEMKPVFDRLKALAQKTAVVFIQHHRKVERSQRHRVYGEDMMGSMLIRGSVDYQLSLIKLSDVADSMTQICVTQTKARYTKNVPPFTVTLADSNGTLGFQYHQGDQASSSKIVQAKETIVELLTQNAYDRQELIDTVVEQGICGIRTVEAALATLTTDGKVAHSDTKPRQYFLTDAKRTIPQACGNTSLPNAVTDTQVREKCAVNHTDVPVLDHSTNAVSPQNLIPQTAGIYREVRNAESPGTVREKVAADPSMQPQVNQFSYSSPNSSRQAAFAHLTNPQLQRRIKQVKHWLLQHERLSTAKLPLALNNQPYALHRWQGKLQSYCALIDAAQSRNIVHDDDWLEMARMIFHTNEGIAGQWIH